MGWTDINLSAKVFGHLSQGLYRTPAGAIKELVSNSFDADATATRIHTGFPRFETFSCEDDGSGIAIDEFRRLMEQGIGTSYKRTKEDPRTSRYNRPVIGRLGIGILSLAQICTQFDLISHHKDGKGAFKATIRFPPYTKREMDRILLKQREKGVEDQIIKGGEYRSEEIAYDSKRAGVRVFTQFLRESFRKRMKSLENYGNSIRYGKSAPYETFEQFMGAVYGSRLPTKSLNLLSDYDQLLFGLALMAPIPYFDGGQGNIVLGVPCLRQYQETLYSYKFRVEVDNLTLGKPLYLPADRQGHVAKDCRLGRAVARKFELKDGPHSETARVRKYPIKVRGADERFSCYEFSYSRATVAGQPLEFSGYLFQQTGRLYPRDIQGILIRLRNVAIGGYDPDIMTYPYGEGPRYSMVSAEVFVEKGFEDALNIDRDSFNALDPHYLRVEAFVHSLLHEVVFPGTWTEEKLRNRERRHVLASEKEAHFLQILTKTTGQRYSKIARVGEVDGRDVAKFGRSAIHFNAARRRIEIDTSNSLVRRILKRRKYGQLAEQILILFEHCNRQASEVKRREVFYSLLSQILSGK